MGGHEERRKEIVGITGNVLLLKAHKRRASQTNVTVFESLLTIRNAVHTWYLMSLLMTLRIV